jgi:zinc protease
MLSAETKVEEQELPKEKSLIEGELENGFKYIIQKNAKPKNRAEFRIVVKVGSLEEDDDQKGIAHFVEHMAFNGSIHFKENELIQYLESIGLGFGSHLNASTGYERTLYKLAIPLEKDNLEKSFLVFEDWAGGLSFDEKEFEKERGVILEEKRQGDTVGLRLYNQYKSMVLGSSKYMDRMTIGDSEIIKNIPLQRVKDFYNDWYRPEFMHFVAVGDFDVKEIEAQIKKHFSPLKNKSNRKRALRKIADNNETRVRCITDKELTSNSFSVQHIDLLTSRRTKQDMREELVESMMLKLFNMKASEQLLKNNPKATSMGLGSSKINSQKGSYSFGVSYRGTDEKLALHELYELIWSFEKHGFSQENLNLIKKEKLSDNEKWYKKLDDRYSSSLASSLVSYSLENSIYVDDREDYKISKALIPDIKLEEINAFFRKILNIKDRAIIFSNTTGNKLSKSEVLDTIEGAKKDAKDFTKVKKIAKNILDKELNATKVISKTFHKKGEFYEFVLENGIKVAFKQTDFSKDSVILKAFSFGGYSLCEVDALDNAQKASGFIAQSGAGDFSVIEVGKILADKQISTSVSISKLTENIFASANSKDIESMFELLYLKLTEPKIDEVVASNRKKQLKYNVEQSTRDPRQNFRKEYTTTFYKNNPRILFDTVEGIEKLNNSKMLEMYKDRFSDMNNFTFVMVGDIEPARVELLISKYLGNLPTKKRDESFNDREQDYLKGEQTFTRAYNNKNITQVGITFHSKINYSKKRAFMLEAMDSILGIRLRELIREEKSAVYGIGVGSRMNRLGRIHSRSSIHFSCEPKRADELVLEILNAVEKLKKEGVTKKELDTYKKKFEVRHETDLRENRYWLSKMLDTYQHNTSLDYEIFELENVLEKVSIEDVKVLANRFFGEDRVVATLKPKK